MNVTKAQVLSAAAQLEHVAIEVSQLAADFIGQTHGAARALKTKSTLTDVVTQTDLASETLIRAEIGARCPGSSVLGEEFDETLGSNRIAWIVDPIDGTVNFLYGLPVVSVSIAAAIDGKVVAGAVTDMLNGDTYSARFGEGARCGDRALGASAPESLALALIGTGFAYEADVRQEQAEVVGRLLPACRDIRCMGSAALNLCWVAAGLLDGYFERNLKPYDYAAGALIASEAGAVVAVPQDGGEGLTSAVAPAIEAEFDAVLKPR